MYSVIEYGTVAVWYNIVQYSKYNTVNIAQYCIVKHNTPQY